MCGRYVRRSDKQRIADHFAVHGPSLPDFGPSWNVAPQTFQPIVRMNRDTGEREIVLMRWGLIPFESVRISLRSRSIPSNLHLSRNKTTQHSSVIFRDTQAVKFC